MGTKSPRELSDLLLTPEEALAMETRGRTDAAVLLPLFGWPDQPGLIFTERRADLRSHAGEISFPGGRRDEGDADFAIRLLKEHGVASIPISPFVTGAEAGQVLRFCFAKKDDTLQKAAERLKKV